MHKEISMRAAPQAPVSTQGSVFVGQGSRWHNPFEFEGGEEGFYAFREWFYSAAYAAVRLRKGVLNKLSEKSLVCDCGDVEHCHATVLVAYIDEQA
jgi:uncharacterized protein YeaO (DUF488 family)